MVSACLDIHGIFVRLDSNCAAVIESLRRDFGYFEVKSPPPSIDLHWTLVCAPGREPPIGKILFFGRKFCIRGSGAARWIRYSDDALSIFDFGNGSGRIYCANEGRLHELAYLAILSRVGEALDLRGLHRVHALGFEWKKQGGLILLPSGGGKSTLALEFLRSHPSVGFISEDTPLICQYGILRAFPLRWSFRLETNLDGIPDQFLRPFNRRDYGPKMLLGIEFMRSRLREAVPLRWVFIGRRTGLAESTIKSAGSLTAAWSLLENMVVGHGVPQMAEYMLRFDWNSLRRLTGIALSRTRALGSALSKAESLIFKLGNSPKESAETLIRFIDNR